MNEAIIDTHDLTVYYGRHRGIIGVNLSVQKGEVFGFLGPNGAGKTTTLRALLDLIRPIAGTAHIFGLDCQRDGVEIRQRVSYLPGELNLYENLTAEEFLKLLSKIRGINGDQSYRQELCDRLDLDPSRKIREYSRGNKQKIGVVSAFMNRPELLILDEPTTGLDPFVHQTVLDLVREVQKEGHTVFFSSHDLPEIQEVCDRVGIIRKGRLIAIEKVEDMIHQNFRKIRITYAEPPDLKVLEMPGVQLIEAKGIHFTYEIRRNMRSFLQKASSLPLLDIETLPITLEEVFFKFYGPNGGTPHA